MSVTVTELIYVQIPYNLDDTRQRSFVQDWMKANNLHPFYLGYELAYDSNRCQLSGFYTKEDAKRISAKWDEYKPMDLADFPDDHYVSFKGGFIGSGFSYYRKSDAPPYGIYAPWYGIDTNLDSFDLVGGVVTNGVMKNGS